MEELGYYISRGLLENGKALANLANLVLPAVLTACDLADGLWIADELKITALGWFLLLTSNPSLTEDLELVDATFNNPSNFTKF